MTVGVTRFLDLIGPRTGQAPRREIYRKRKARLYRYEGAHTYRTPLLFIPNLGISRPWVFDLLPGSSFVEYMVRAGFDFYLLDWGVFGPEDDDLTLEECVTDILPRVWQRVLETAAGQELSVLGYCMGAALALSLAASRPELPLRNFIDLAGPVGFSKAGLLARWLDRKVFDVDRVVETLAPPESVRALLGVVGSRDKDWLEVPGSHLSLVLGEEASQHVWPAMSRWLAVRS